MINTYTGVVRLCIAYSLTLHYWKDCERCAKDVPRPWYNMNDQSVFNQYNTITLHFRSMDLYVNGGTPYEKGVEVDPRISRRSE